MTVDVQTAPDFLLGTPRRLFSLPASGGYDPSSTPVGAYDPTPDGKRFLVAMSTGKVESAVSLVVNWTTALPR